MLISLSAEAKADVDEATDWYIAEGAFTAVDHFTDELEHVLGLLSQFPKMGAPGPHQTRILPMLGFPYSLVYRIQSKTVRIIAIAHQSRRPVYWAGRG